MEPALAEAYGRMLKRVTFALDKALMFAIRGLRLRNRLRRDPANHDG